MKARKIATFLLSMLLCTAATTAIPEVEIKANAEFINNKDEDSLLLKKYKFLQELQNTTIKALQNQNKTGTTVLETPEYLKEVLEQEQSELRKIAEDQNRRLEKNSEEEQQQGVYIQDNENCQLFSCYENNETQSLEDVILEASERAKKRAEQITKENEVRKKQLEKLVDESLNTAYTVDLTEDEIKLCNSLPDNVPNDNPDCKSEVRSYMGYHKVTSKRSPQYALLNHEKTYTDEKTGIRMHRGRYCIAVGTGYTATIGTKIDLVFEDGSILKCILGDVKSDYHTDSTHRFHVGGYDHGVLYPGDGSVAEFIVDYEVFNRNTDKNPVNTALNQFGKIRKVVVLN